MVLYRRISFSEFTGEGFFLELGIYFFAELPAMMPAKEIKNTYPITDSYRCI